MEPKDVKPVFRRRSRQELVELLREFEAVDGMTVRSFCLSRQISEGAFYSFRKRHLHKEPKPVGFIQFEPGVASGKVHAAILFAEVKGIKLYQPVSADFLKALAI